MKNIIKERIFLFISFCIILLFFRYIPHPPNFTPVIALSMYGPIFFGLSSIPFIILAFAVSDMFIGFHSLLIWTWGSLLLIGLTSKYYNSAITRVMGCFISALIFYIVTNFGVWLFSSFYEKTFQGLLQCYTLAIPFFGNTLLGTIILGLVIETILLIKKKNFTKEIIK